MVAMLFIFAVVSAPGHSCPVGRALLTSQRGTIASVVSHETGHGTDTCPWVIRVLPGQRVNITLLDFSVTSGTAYGSAEFCKAYAIIRERSPAGNSQTLCGGSARYKDVFVSRGNQVEIRIIQSKKRENRDFFLLKYEGEFPLRAIENTCLQYWRFPGLV